ncbi:hypothetical protein VTJ83DRAFT_4430 [Remersonia thermophila]|uniref:alpha-1,2-Mannosidase n=1 Tax=Remersonia thermophila TaxID=72144 RepID=A0ABR4D9Y5_9PEZI
MAFARRRGILVLVPSAAFLLMLLYLWNTDSAPLAPSRYLAGGGTVLHQPVQDWQPRPEFAFWSQVPQHYPPSAVRGLPRGKPVRFPRVQAAKFPAEASGTRRRQLRERRAAVKRTMARCWGAYRKHAWLADEVTPVSGGPKNPFGGWGATLVDALDTLWIMGMRAEFREAVDAAETGINFTTTNIRDVNIFETNIRYLGGFLAAFDLSGDVRLLRKAAEVGEMLYKAFDTPNHMPITRWDWQSAARGHKQEAPGSVLLAEIGSLSMEFTRLSMLTGEPKWFDAVQRIAEAMAAQQDDTSLPGLWPLAVNARSAVFNEGTLFPLGAMADSAYEYLPKMAALLGGLLPVYRTMYEKAMDAALRHNLFRPMNPTGEDILVAGQVRVEGKGRYSLEPQGQHLACFMGGLMALGGRLFDRPVDMDAAVGLVNGCIWAYKSFPHGIMAETFYAVPCNKSSPDARAVEDLPCRWDEDAWKLEVLRKAGRDAQGKDAAALAAAADAVIANHRLPQGFTAIPDRRYILRPEAIESVFVLYRVTGAEELLDVAWDMFTAIEKATATELANSEVRDVTSPEKPKPADSMESFWLGETLKYFYLIFSEPDLISLDEFVFNTEAHPFRRLVA